MDCVCILLSNLLYTASGVDFRGVQQQLVEVDSKDKQTLFVLG
jgi:hypothetical protein